jgi:O-succinylbenzoic acid--CoA ligase
MSLTKLKKSEQTFYEYTEFIKEWHSNSAYVMQYTSGSTGNPKQIKIAKSQMLASAQMTIDFLGMKQMNSALLCISPKYIGGKMLIVRALECDLHFVIAPTAANPIIELNSNVDFAALVPLQLETIINETPEKLNLIDTIIVGGAPVPKALADKLKGFKTKVYSTFGMTETVSHIALKALHLNAKYFEAIGNTTFKQSSDQSLIITAPELGISSLKTNDVVELLDCTRFKWLGRSDFVINSGGIKVNPESIEEVFKEYIHIPFIVTGISDDQLGEKVIILSEKKINLNQLKELTVEQIGLYKFPKRNIESPIFFTENGKIDRLKTIKNLQLEE